MAIVPIEALVAYIEAQSAEGKTDAEIGKSMLRVGAVRPGRASFADIEVLYNGQWVSISGEKSGIKLSEPVTQGGYIDPATEEGYQAEKKRRESRGGKMMDDKPRVKDPTIPVFLFPQDKIKLDDSKTTVISGGVAADRTPLVRFALVVDAFIKEMITAEMLSGKRAMGTIFSAAPLVYGKKSPNAGKPQPNPPLKIRIPVHDKENVDSGIKCKLFDFTKPYKRPNGGTGYELLTMPNGDPITNGTIDSVLKAGTSYTGIVNMCLCDSQAGISIITRFTAAFVTPGAGGTIDDDEVFDAFGAGPEPATTTTTEPATTTTTTATPTTTTATTEPVPVPVLDATDLANLIAE